MTLPSCQIGRLTLHAHRELLDRGAPVAIGGRALDLLSTLAAAEGRVVSKDELLAAVWNGAIVEDNALQAQVSAVRKALGSEATRLVTVHGRGYRLELDRRPPTAAAPQPASVAVLAFENLTGDPANDYLAFGIAEELIAALTRVPDLRVPARSSSFAYQGRGLDVRIIARELGVATVLEGTVRGHGGRLRVSAELVDARTGFQIWAQTFERNAADLIALQDELAAAVAAALSRRVKPRVAGPASAEAMHLVLQALQMGRTLHTDAVLHGEKLARKAIALEPAYARAHEVLVGTLFLKDALGLTSENVLSEARHEGELALALDPTLDMTHGLLLAMAANAADWLEAAERFRLARDVNPLTGVHCMNFASHVLLPTGKLAEAARVAEEGVGLSPEHPTANVARAMSGWLTGDFATARRYIDTALLLGQPFSRSLVEVVQSEEAFARGALAEACAPIATLLSRELESAEAADVARLVFAALAGDARRDAASRAIESLVDAADASGALWRRPQRASPIPGVLLHWQVRLGALDAAFAVAGRVVERRRVTGRLANPSMLAFWASDMASFRRDPRFQEIVRDLGLFAFWERYGPPDGHEVRDGRLVVL